MKLTCLELIQNLDFVFSGLMTTPWKASRSYGQQSFPKVHLVYQLCHFQHWESLCVVFHSLVSSRFVYRNSPRWGCPSKPLLSQLPRCYVTSKIAHITLGLQEIGLVILHFLEQFKHLVVCGPFQSSTSQLSQRRFSKRQRDFLVLLFLFWKHSASHLKTFFSSSLWTEEAS